MKAEIHPEMVEMCHHMRLWCDPQHTRYPTANARRYLWKMSSILHWTTSTVY